ncbi:MAG: tetratricopeptide repeat protein [Bdellovibrionota bacterium]
MKNFLLVGLVFLNSCTSTPESKITEKKHEISRSAQTLDELYQRGKSERIQGSPKECLKTFSKVIDLRKTVQDSLFAYSLYQSGLCHEMLGEYERAIAVYQDALRVKAIVNSELALLEIPSRLAISYERVQDVATANNYYLIVKRYIDDLKKNKKSFNSKKEYYAETLFQMGTIANNYQPTKSSDPGILAQDFSSYLKSISYAQEYLMLVLELEVQPYTEYALKQMVTNFQSSFEFIKNIGLDSGDDEVVAQRDRQMRQKDMSTILAHHIDEFETESSVQKKSKRSDYKEIFSKLKEIKTGLDAIINERPIGEGLTLEAQKLQDPKKEGRFVPIKNEANEDEKNGQ